MSSLIQPQSASIETARVERVALPLCAEIREQGLHIKGIESKEEVCQEIGQKVLSLFGDSVASPQAEVPSRVTNEQRRAARLCIAYAINPEHNTIETVNNCIQSGVLDLAVTAGAHVELSEDLPTQDPSEPRAHSIATLSKGDFTGKIIQYGGPIGLEDNSVADASSVWSFHAHYK